jgi:hypothetical protein
MEWKGGGAVGTRLALVTLLLLTVIVVFGWMSIDSEFYALETAAKMSGRADVAALQHQLDQPVVIEAELLPDGRSVILMPQHSEILVKDGKVVESLEGAINFKDGKFYHWDDYRPTRAWVFVVISEDKPKVTVEP